MRRQRGRAGRTTASGAVEASPGGTSTGAGVRTGWGADVTDTRSPGAGTDGCDSTSKSPAWLASLDAKAVEGASISEVTSASASSATRRITPQICAGPNRRARGSLEA